jgi:hypothetical protein
MRCDPCSDFPAEEDDVGPDLPPRKFVDGRGRDDDWDVLPKTRGNILFMRGLQPGRQPHATPTPLSTDMMMKVVPPYPVRDVSEPSYTAFARLTYRRHQRILGIGGYSIVAQLRRYKH